MRCRLAPAALGLALAAMAWAGVCLAAPPPKAPPPPMLFLSPSGQPFRQSPTMPDPLKAWFDQVDTNHDGVIDRAEFRADAARFFKKLDENGDGVIDGFEVMDYETKIVPELAAWDEGISGAEISADRRDRKRGPHGHGRPVDAIAQLIDEPEPVSGADFNFDSRITFAEWMRATDQRFDLLDEAKTGKLTLDELRARLAKRAKQRR